MLRLKSVGITTRQLTPPPPPPPTKREPWVGRELFGVQLPILYFKFQFFSSSMQIFNIYSFLNLTFLFRKKNLIPEMPKDHKNLKNRQTVVNEISREI